MNCPSYGKEYIVNSQPYSIDTSGLTHVDWSLGQAFVTTDYTTRVASGAQYKCILAHTADASNEPGVGASFETYWQLIAEPWVKYIQPVDTNNHYRWFSDGSTTPPTVTRDLSQQGPPGTDGVQSSDGSVTDIISLTQAEYDALTPNATTFYIITD